MSHDDGLPFWKYLLRPAHLAVILGVCTATMLLEHWGWMHGFETAALDSLLVLKKPQRAENVVIVDITESDYQDVFRGRSPLDPNPVRNLLAGILRARPRAIGVDLDTSDPSFFSLRDVAGDAPIVWALPAWAAEPEGGAHTPGLQVLLNPFHHPVEQVAVGSVLGGAPEGLHTGLALMPMDQDGSVRRYFRKLYVASPSGVDSKKATLPWAVLQAAGHAAPETSNEFLLNFAGDRYALTRIPASAVLAINADGEGDSPLLGLLENKIVLVGGTYHAARDTYITPLGPMAGVDLIALAIESELRGGGIRKATHGLKIAFDLVAACAILFVCHRFRLRAALLLGLFGIPLLALIGSYLLFSSLAYWISFVPVMIGVWIHQAYHHALEYRRLYENLHAAKGPPSP